MKGKKWLWPGLLLVGFAVGGQSDGRGQLGHRQVVGLPPGFDAGAPTEPYAGPHPSRLERPAETFRFPIMLGQVGPSEPLFAGPKQYPFICDTVNSGLGVPLADNSAGIGTPVESIDDATDDKRTAGSFSKDCLAPT